MAKLKFSDWVEIQHGLSGDELEQIKKEYDEYEGCSSISENALIIAEKIADAVMEKQKKRLMLKKRTIL